MRFRLLRSKSTDRFGLLLHAMAIFQQQYVIARQLIHIDDGLAKPAGEVLWGIAAMNGST